MNGEKLWLVGKWVDLGPWEFQGLYTSHELAIARCETADWFVAPVTVDERVPTATTRWPNFEYPRAPIGGEGD